MPSSESENVVEVEAEGTSEAGTNGESEGQDEGELVLDSEKRKPLIGQKNDRSLFQYHRWYQQGRLDLNPDWQREYVWSDARASALIESILMDFPIPFIYLAKKKGGFQVIDGVQRLTSVFRYFENKFALSGLVIKQELKNKKFRDLDVELQKKLEDFTIPSFELNEDTPDDLLFLIFERLNTGGIKLNEMEIRNCIFRGKLNDLIKKLAKNSDFLQCVNRKNIGKRMEDRALVLRFLAFYNTPYERATQGLKAFLNRFFEDYRDANDSRLEEFEAKFKHAMRCCVTVFGNEGFRLRRDDSRGGGQWAPLPNASIFQVISTSFTRFDHIQVTQRSDSIFEEYLDLLTDSKWIDSVTKSTGDLANIKYAFEAWNERLDLVMKGSVPLDEQRIFSQSLKKELFSQNSTCKICGQQIKSVFDAALDHEIHYWRGGKTIPSNARLVHRVCNLKREKSESAI